MREKNKVGRKKGVPNSSTPTRKKLYLEFLKKTYGNYTAACKAGNFSHDTVQKWKRDDEKFKKACEDIVLSGVDTRVEIAEHKLQEAIERGERWAVNFILKTLGKSKGYTEKIETEHTLINKDIKFVFGEENKDKDDNINE